MWQERPFHHLTLSQIEDALEPFRGDIQQQPPLYSAIKQGGQPLYKLARQGKTDVERPFRAVTIHELTLIRWEARHFLIPTHSLRFWHLHSLTGARFGRSIGLRRTPHRPAAAGGGHVWCKKRPFPWTISPQTIWQHICCRLIQPLPIYPGSICQKRPLPPILQGKLVPRNG